MSYRQTGFNHVVVMQRVRLLEQLRRFVEPEDAELSDHDFVMAVHHRYLKYRGIPIIDPNE